MNEYTKEEIEMQIRRLKDIKKEINTLEPIVYGTDPKGRKNSAKLRLYKKKFKQDEQKLKDMMFDVWEEKQILEPMLW